jgi:hypothetical protein
MGTSARQAHRLSAGELAMSRVCHLCIWAAFRGCASSGETRAPTISSRSELVVDITMQPDPTWKPYDVSGWRVFVPTDWIHTELAGYSAFHSPNDAEISVQLQARAISIEEVFPMEKPYVTRCHVRGESCRLSRRTFLTPPFGMKQYASVAVGIQRGGLVWANCNTLGTAASPICLKILGTLRPTEEVIK